LTGQEGFHAGDKINVTLDLMMSLDAAVVWTYLAAFLATVVVYVCFIYRVGGFVLLQVLLKDFATGPLYDGGGHGWRRRWGVVQGGSRGSLPAHLCQFLGSAFASRLLRSHRTGAACGRRDRLPTPSESHYSGIGGAT